MENTIRKEKKCGQILKHRSISNSRLASITRTIDLSYSSRSIVSMIIFDAVAARRPRRNRSKRIGHDAPHNIWPRVASRRVRVGSSTYRRLRVLELERRLEYFTNLEELLPPTSLFPNRFKNPFSERTLSKVRTR